MSYVDKVAAIASPFSPVCRPNENDWYSTESYLGTEFSTDYKAILSTFGFGRFGELELPSPSGPELRRLSIENLKKYKEMVERDGPKLGVRFFRYPSGLICVGRTGIRVDICLQPPLKVRRKWTVVVCDFDVYHAIGFPSILSEFIYKLYMKKLRSKWLDSFRAYLWPSDASHFFTPSGANLGCPAF